MQESWASSPAIRKSMQSNRSKDTGPELALRRALHALGLRYRVCARPIPDLRQTVDVLFSSAKVAVEVWGCFWHGCHEHYRPPSSNSEFWSQKIKQNQQRDQDKARALHDAGWLLEVVWEHEDSTLASQRIAQTVRSRRQALSGVASTASRRKITKTDARLCIGRYK
jgi:DNA mismatch endonuclease, patch repair protein